MLIQVKIEVTGAAVSSFIDTFELTVLERNGVYIATSNFSLADNEEIIVGVDKSARGAAMDYVKQIAAQT